GPLLLGSTLAPTPPHAATASAPLAVCLSPMSAATARARADRGPTLLAGHARPRSVGSAAFAGNDGTPLPKSVGRAAPLPTGVPACVPPSDSLARRRCIAERRGPLPDLRAPHAVASDGRGRCARVRIPERHAGSIPGSPESPPAKSARPATPPAAHRRGSDTLAPRNPEHVVDSHNARSSCSVSACDSRTGRIPPSRPTTRPSSVPVRASGRTSGVASGGG